MALSQTPKKKCLIFVDLNCCEIQSSFLFRQTCNRKVQSKVCTFVYAYTMYSGEHTKKNKYAYLHEVRRRGSKAKKQKVRSLLVATHMFLDTVG